MSSVTGCTGRGGMRAAVVVVVAADVAVVLFPTAASARPEREHGSADEPD